MSEPTAKQSNPENRSSCPIACTLDLIGDRWTLLILRDLFLGKSRYDEFLDSPENISTNILADRLRRLESQGMLSKQPYGNHRRRMEYQLTDRGRSLGPVLHSMLDWGLAHVAGTARFPHVGEALEQQPQPEKNKR